MRHAFIAMMMLAAVTPALAAAPDDVETGRTPDRFGMVWTGARTVLESLGAVADAPPTAPPKAQEGPAVAAAPVPDIASAPLTEAPTMLVAAPLPAVEPGVKISSDSGEYDYEDLPADAETALLPESIPPSRMANHKPMIAIVIDDMGVDRKRSERAETLPAEVTLSYLPYSKDVTEQTAAAKEDGHELLVHMPMQPERRTANPGPDYLGPGMSPLELRANVEKNLAAFDGYDGVNNHMGSRFTQDADGLGVVMAALKERNLVFLDSRTSPRSVAEKVARAYGLATTHRDVFIDNDESPAAVEQSLKSIERVARHAGTAIAIGHPKDVTLAALEQWLPTLKGKGFELVALHDVIELRSGKRPAVAANGGALSPVEKDSPPPAP